MGGMLKPEVGGQRAQFLRLRYKAAEGWGAIARFLCRHARPVCTIAHRCTRYSTLARRVSLKTSKDEAGNAFPYSIGNRVARRSIMSRQMSAMPGPFSR